MATGMLNYYFHAASGVTSADDEGGEARQAEGSKKILYVPVTRKVILTTENNSLPANHFYSMGYTVLVGFKTIPHKLSVFAGFYGGVCLQAYACKRC